MDTTKVLQPQFAELRFKSKNQLDEWLKKNTHSIIEIEDHGQDLLKIWVHETGEILDTNAQNGIWVGCFVDMDLIKPGKPMVVQMKNDGNKWREHVYPIERIKRTVNKLK